jgi:hypothetical protein
MLSGMGGARSPVRQLEDAMAKVLRTSMAVLAVGAAAMAGVGPAQAATTTSTTAATPIYDCIWKADYGIDLFRTRTSTTADYFVAKGTLMTQLGCGGQPTGRSYTDCGGGNQWVHIDGAKNGWAALGCISFVRRVLRA